jgi:metal-responsive CopG/Arc/MetJ family transcriptional regulator
MQPDEKKFTDTVVVRCPERMSAMIDKAAERRFMKPSEFVRMAIAQSLKSDGIEWAS